MTKQLRCLPGECDVVNADTSPNVSDVTTVPHSDTCGSATHSLNIGAGSR